MAVPAAPFILRSWRPAAKHLLYWWSTGRTSPTSMASPTSSRDEVAQLEVFRAALGYDATVRRFEYILPTCHPSNRADSGPGSAPRSKAEAARSPTRSSSTASTDPSTASPPGRTFVTATDSFLLALMTGLTVQPLSGPKATPSCRTRSP